MSNYYWICFTDTGIKHFDAAYNLKTVEQLLILQENKDFEIHLTDEATYYFFITEYLNGCLELEYKGVCNE